MKLSALKKWFWCLLISAGLTQVAFSQTKKNASEKWYEVNLLVNADAEEGNPRNDITGWKPLPVVETWGSMVDAYGHTGGEWEFDCDEKCGLPPGAGTYYFRLPVDNSYPVNALWQETDLSGIADTLAKRKINFTLSGYIAGFKCDQPGCGKGMLMISFYDKTGKELAAYEASKDNNEMKTAPNTEDQRMHQFEKISTGMEVPLNANKARVTMKADSKECCNGAYIFFDNLNLSLGKGAYRENK